MTLLLTSAGITNKALESTLLQMLNKPFSEASVVFVPTASNIEKGDKTWLIDNLVQLKRLNFKQIEIADISAVPESIWKPKLQEADVMFFGGGDPNYLMEWFNKTNMTNILSELLKSKIYVGISARSMVTNPDLSLKASQELYGDDLTRTENMKGLGLVDFYFFPHLNSEYFINLRKEKIESLSKKIKGKIYVADDESAVMVVDGKVEIVGEGECLMFNDVV